MKQETYLTILFIGDVVGKLARRSVVHALPDLKKESGADVVIVNGENAAHGHGITESNFVQLMEGGVDFITLGDHAFDRNETHDLLNQNKNKIIRPVNFPQGASGEGFAVLEIGTKKLLVINAVGRVFMKADYDDPFRAIDEVLKRYEGQNLAGIIVDFQAEATSEKAAMGWYLDGRVSALLGTHTHVPTADAKVLPQRTAFISDIGMVGARDSVIGVQKEPIVKSFLDQMKSIKNPEEEGVCQLNSVVVKIDPKTGNAVSIKRLDKEINL